MHMSFGQVESGVGGPRLGLDEADSSKRFGLSRGQLPTHTSISPFF